MGEFGLVNMNGRLYDPTLGRFLSPDNYVQEPGNSQSFNRYSYCLNNPLKYTDPSGEAFWVPALIAFGSGIINAALNSDNIHNWTQGLCFFGVGAASVAIAACGPVGIFASGALLAGGNNLLAQSFNKGLGNVDWGYVGGSALIGGATSYFSATLGDCVNSITGNWFNSIENTVVRETANGVVGGSITGALMGSMGYAMDTEQSFWGSLGKGAGLGALEGGLGGYAKGKIEQRKENLIKTLDNYDKTEVPDAVYDKPLQRHHFLTDKNRKFTPRFKDITDKYGLNLDGDWNVELLPHQGRHPNDYHI